MALNKADLTEQWELTDDDRSRLGESSLENFVTSAKSGARVKRAFEWLALAMCRSTP